MCVYIYIYSDKLSQFYNKLCWSQLHTFIVICFIQNLVLFKFKLIKLYNNLEISEVKYGIHVTIIS